MAASERIIDKLAESAGTGTGRADSSFSLEEQCAKAALLGRPLMVAGGFQSLFSRSRISLAGFSRWLLARTFAELAGFWANFESFERRIRLRHRKVGQ